MFGDDGGPARSAIGMRSLSTSRFEAQAMATLRI
jgi:hypothetical protein